MEVQAGQIGNQTQGNPIFPGTFWTGPLLAGNVLHGSGTGNLAGTGNSVGNVSNVGYVQMVQTAPITQAGTGNVTVTGVVIPAQSFIEDMHLLVTKAWDGGNTTLTLGTTGNSTFYGAAGSIQGNATGIVSINPLAGNATQVANWQNTGATDIQLQTTSQATGNGTGFLVVSYMQGVNN